MYNILHLDTFTRVPFNYNYSRITIAYMSYYYYISDERGPILITRNNALSSTLS